MAKAKFLQLGKVTKVHDSGIVETDKKKRAQIKAQKGDMLQMEVATRKVSIKPTKDTGGSTSDGGNTDTDAGAGETTGTQEGN